MRILLIPLYLLFVCSCMSTTVVLDDRWDPKSKPVYEDYFDQFGFGFVGRNEVVLAKVCMDQVPYAVKRSQTLEDLALSVIFLGIYSPVTISVWCGEAK